MIDLLRARRRLGHSTLAYPDGPPPDLPERFRGRPVLDASRCVESPPPSTPMGQPAPSAPAPTGSSRAACLDACPTEAITLEPRLSIDLGRCLFCGDCAAACPNGAIGFDRDHRLAARRRGDLMVREGEERRLAAALDHASRRLFGRSLKLRQVSAGGCNACESEINVLSTVVWDLGRFGIQMVASPRHADGLLVTGPVTDGMRLALRKTWEAVAPPKIVIAVGACAISGGPFRDHPETSNGADSVVPVDLYVPGCPPHPLTILDGLLRLLGRLEEKEARR